MDTQDFTPGQNGQPDVYPAPLFVHNTFIEYRPGRPASLEGFYNDREAQSCPTSWQETYDGTGEPARVTLRGPRLYTPGEVLTRTALLDSELPLGGATVSSVPPGKLVLPNSQEPISQCSTVDTQPEAVDPFSMAQVGRGLSDDDFLFASLGYEGMPPDSALGSPMLPTEGSKAHYLYECKPCAFVFKDGCKNGLGCIFCHLCKPGEKKRRKKEKHIIVRAMRQVRTANWGGYMGMGMLM